VQEEQKGSFEGDWDGFDRGKEGERFVPDEREIGSQERGVLWGLVGVATLWGVFGPAGTEKA
jgi:hypothetical protein